MTKKRRNSYLSLSRVIPVADYSGGVLPQQLAELIAWLKELEGMSWLVPNPFHEPPEAVVKAGMENIEMYFEDLFAEGLIAERRGMKAVIVGQGGAGKTR